MRRFNILPSNLRLMLITLILSHTQTNLVNSDPHVCNDRLKNHFADRLTEYSLSPDEDINFLNYGEPCNNNAQVRFEKQLLQKYKEITSDPYKNNEELITALDEVWNDFRRRSVDGVLGDRVCNPRRLLACHGTLKQCVCRPDFQLEVPYNKSSHLGITIHSETVETENMGKDRVEMVTACRGRTNCEWRAPWLGFCNIPCVKDHFCIGIETSGSGVDANQRCVRCDPFREGGLEECQEEAAKLSLDPHAEDEKESQRNGSRNDRDKNLITILFTMVFVILAKVYKYSQ